MTSGPERTSSGFFAHRGLIGFACAGAMAEAGMLVVMAPAARALAPQVTALPPLAIFHDLRWLYAVQRSWLEFALLVVGLVLARSGVNALLIRLSWPAGVAAPAPSAVLRSSLAFTVVTSLLLSPIVSLAFGVAIVPFSWPFLALLSILLLIALPLSHGGVTDTWWRVLPPAPAMGWLLVDFLALSVTATVAGRLPAAAAVPLAGLAGLVNARAWYRVVAVTAPVQASRSRVTSWVPAVPLATTAAIVLVLAVVRVGFLIGTPPVREGPPPALPPSAVGVQRPENPLFPATRHRSSRQPAVLEVSGFGSSCCGLPLLSLVMPDAIVQQFSYRGLTPSGAPLPYGPAASNLPLPELGNRIATQVQRLHAETGRPVDVVAESEGTLGVDAMLAEHPHVPVGSVAMLSPILAPGRVSYRAGAGSGLVTGGQLKAVVWFVGGLSPFGTSGAQTFISSVNSVGARFAAAAARHHPSRVLELVPLADTLTLPACRLPANVLVVPAFHGELLGDPQALRMVRDFLLYRPVHAPAGMRATAELFAAAGSAWRMPELTSPSPPCHR